MRSGRARRWLSGLLLGLTGAWLGAACGGPPEVVAPPAPASATAAASSTPEPIASTASSASSAPVASASATPAAPPAPPADEGPCPADMVFVDGEYCEEVERRCLKEEENKPNHLTLCHRFAHETKCRGKPEKRSFCIDKYEYPNREGAHPPWQVSWYDGEATCRSLGKRLCYETEWITACEGPDHLPFPYGWDRDQTACNIDNTWINPQLDLAYSKDPAKSEPELARLDQSVASGAMSRCKSGYGVHDMTGNFDEWVTRDRPSTAKDKSKWAALKGGAWGHVRNACRPVTTSHAPEFTYYFVSFRCCADPKGREPYVPKKATPAPKVEPKDRAPIPAPKNPTGPSKHKVQPEN